MRSYSLPEGLWLSFFSKRFYQEVARRWQIRCLGYLLLLTVLTSMPAFFRVRQNMKSLDAQGRGLIATVPEIRVQKGQVLTPENKAFEIRFGKGPADWILVDPTGKTASLADTTASVLVTKTNVYFKRSPTETRIYSLANVEQLTIDQAHLTHWLNVFQRWFPWLFLWLLLTVQTLVRLLEAACLALFGLMLVRWLEATLDFGPLLALAVTSMTPSVLLSALQAITGKPSPGLGLLTVTLLIGYFIYALNAATDQPLDDAPLD